MKVYRGRAHEIDVWPPAAGLASSASLRACRQRNAATSCAPLPRASAFPCLRAFFSYYSCISTLMRRIVRGLCERIKCEYNIQGGGTAVGRGHVSLLTNLDTWHSEPCNGIEHLLICSQQDRAPARRGRGPRSRSPPRRSGPCPRPRAREVLGWLKGASWPMHSCGNTNIKS
jgi:hypothetical protein